MSQPVLMQAKADETRCREGRPRRGRAGREQGHPMEQGRQGKETASKCPHGYLRCLRRSDLHCNRPLVRRAPTMTTQAIQAMCSAEIPVAYFSYGGWFYGMTQGLGLKNIFLRREQFRQADSSPFCLQFTQDLVAGKIKKRKGMEKDTFFEQFHVSPAGAPWRRFRTITRTRACARSA